MRWVESPKNRYLFKIDLDLRTAAILLLHLFSNQGVHNANNF